MQGRVDPDERRGRGVHPSERGRPSRPADPGPGYIKVILTHLVFMGLKKTLKITVNKLEALQNFSLFTISPNFFIDN